MWKVEFASLPQNKSSPRKPFCPFCPFLFSRLCKHQVSTFLSLTHKSIRPPQYSTGPGHILTKGLYNEEKTRFEMFLGATLERERESSTQVLSLAELHKASSVLHHLWACTALCMTDVCCVQRVSDRNCHVNTVCQRLLLGAGKFLQNYANIGNRQCFSTWNILPCSVRNGDGWTPACQQEGVNDFLALIACMHSFSFPD